MGGKFCYCIYSRMFGSKSILGGVTQGCPYPISQIFYPPISHIPDFLTPISHIPDFLTPNIPYPRFHSQLPISQILQDYNVYVYIHLTYNWWEWIQFCWIYLLFLSIYLYMGIWNCTLTMYTIQICTWGVIKMHSIIHTLNFTKHRWKITEMKICCMYCYWCLPYI